MSRGMEKTLWKLLEISVWQWVMLGVLIMFLFWLVFWIRARFLNDDDPDAEDHLMLTQIGDLHRGGDLTEEEYRSIKGRLVDRLDDSPSSPTKPSS